MQMERLLQLKVLSFPAILQIVTYAVKSLLDQAPTLKTHISAVK